MIVRLHFGTCGRCGDVLVTDNTGSGRAPNHLAGEPADGHLFVYGTPAGTPEHAASMRARTLEIQGAEDVERAENPFPPPGTPRPILEDEWGTARQGRRQVRKVAETNGWHVERAQHVRGPVADQHGRLARWVDSFGVVFARGERKALAIWESKPDEDAYSLVLAGAPGRGFLLNVAAFKDLLREPA